ncbi:MAG: hypothetical protein QGI05_04395, partial [Candidatus Omnitrophota bacterium]|nr:hypothetical protein [Candidatus Omnitrophota bacterium]
MDKAVQAPQRQDHVLFFEEDVTRKQSEISEAPISLAQLFLTRDMLNREYVGLEDYKTRLGITDHDEPPDETGYNNEINSAITGQDASTFIREAIQNARDATRSAQPHGDTNNTVEVRCYVIPRGPDEYELVTEIQDNGVGMDDHVILNRLLPLDETTKRQHMGQGFYTTWADTRPGDKVEIETSKGNGVGHVLRQSRNTDGEIMVDSLEEVKLFESPRGTSIRQRRYFSTLEEATQQYGKLTERLNFYCGAVSDVNINFNGGQINEDLELGAQVQFGELGVSRFLIGDGHNRITQDELSMPVSLNVVTVRDRYWQAIPSEVQDELLTQGITTDIAPNLLLTKARTEPAYEEYLPFIRRSESLKALLFLSRSVSRISNPDVLLRILEALENADRDNPEVDRMAGYLNFIDEDDYGQRQFHLVSEEDMKENWYQLLVRIEMDVVV